MFNLKYFLKIINKNLIGSLLLLVGFSFCGVDKDIKKHPMKVYPKQQKEAEKIEDNIEEDKSEKI